MGEHDIGAMLAEAIELVREACAARGIELSSSGPTSVTLRVDRARILQVLSNLLSNAVAHTPHGGKIAVRAFATDGVIRLEVADTGSGIAPDEVERIFDRFWAKRSTGAGLGLYIARGIVRAHGGAIVVRSPPGEGATFEVTLPRTGPAGKGRVTLAQ
jgi:signal transduction histidine kinase